VASRPAARRQGEADAAGAALLVCLADPPATALIVWLAQTLGLGPLLLPLLLVPTLDELDGRAPRRAWALPLERAFVRSNLLLSKSNVDAGRWWTRLTYWMLHTNEMHLYSNLISFVPSAIAVNTACGTSFMWATFLAGSAVGSLNLGNREWRAPEKCWLRMPAC
jgi:membrane associated rhomboid family serine protease